MNKIAFLIVFFTYLGAPKLLAQGLSLELESSRRAYFDGKFVEVVGQLKSIDDDLLIKAEWVDKYRLLVRSLLLLDKDKEAEVYFSELMRTYPDLMETKDALPRFNEFRESRQVKVKSFNSLAIGVTMPRLTVLKDHSFSSKFTRPNLYGVAPGIHIDLNRGWMLNDFLYVSGSIHFNQYGLTFEEFQMDIQKITAVEQYNEVSFPVSMGVSKPLRSIEFFFSVGIRPVFLLPSSASLTFSADEVRTGGQITPFTFIDSYPVREYRNSAMTDFQVSMGCKRYFNRRFISVELTYVYGPNNRTSEENRFEDEALYHIYSYVPDDITRDLFQVAVSVGFAKFKVSQK